MQSNSGLFPKCLTHTQSCEVSSWEQERKARPMDISPSNIPLQHKCQTDSYKLSDWWFTVQQRLSTLIINLIWISNLVTYDWYYKRIRSIMEAFNRFFIFRISWNSPYHSFQQRLLLVLWSNTSSGSDQQLDTISWRQIYTYSFQWWKLCRAATT